MNRYLKLLDVFVLFLGCSVPLLLGFTLLVNAGWVSGVLGLILVVSGVLALFKVDGFLSIVAAILVMVVFCMPMMLFGFFELQPRLSFAEGIPVLIVSWIVVLRFVWIARDQEKQHEKQHDQNVVPVQDKP